MMHKPQPFWLTKNKRQPTTSLAKTAITVVTLLTPAVHPTTHQWNWDKCQEARGTFATIKESKIKTDSTTKANIKIIINPIITKMPTTHAITSSQQGKSGWKPPLNPCKHCGGMHWNYECKQKRFNMLPMADTEDSDQP
jgi:hypothetical protein